MRLFVMTQWINDGTVLTRVQIQTNFASLTVNYDEFLNICSQVNLASIPKLPENYTRLIITDGYFTPSYMTTDPNGNPGENPIPPSGFPAPFANYLIYFDKLQEMINIHYGLPKDYYPFSKESENKCCTIS